MCILFSKERLNTNFKFSNVRDSDDIDFVQKTIFFISFPWEFGIFWGKLLKYFIYYRIYWLSTKVVCIFVLHNQLFLILELIYVSNLTNVEVSGSHSAVYHIVFC